MTTIELPGNEAEVLATLLDAAVRHLGAQSAKAVAHFLDKIEAAKAEAAKPAPIEPAEAGA